MMQFSRDFQRFFVQTDCGGGSNQNLKKKEL